VFQAQHLVLESIEAKTLSLLVRKQTMAAERPPLVDEVDYQRKI
jgi:hypothetical protein